MVTGIVNSRMRAVLPPDALVQVELVDISRKDAPARTINLTEIWIEGRQFPIPFGISYYPATIDQNGSYAVRVSILQKGQPLFKNTATYQVITNGVRSNVEILVEPIPAPGGKSR